MLKQIIKKIIPAPLLCAYHKILAVFANIRYRFPSRKLIVIGVTGTKGKSSTVFMLTRILEEAGFRVGSVNSIFFKIGQHEQLNKTKQSMLGRTKLQRMLRKMARAGCTHAVLEVTSEGVAQHRQWGIAFDVVIFTNLSPEHIESHGSFENYARAKQLIFKNLYSTRRKRIQGRAIPKVIVVNGADEHAAGFLKHRADTKWIVYPSCERARASLKREHVLCAEKIEQTESGVALSVEDTYIHMRVFGSFMAENALLAIAAARSLGVSLSACELALEAIEYIPGRAHIIKTRGALVMIDYAHEPKSFEAILKTARQLVREQRIIAVFGATGGGRDRAKRPKMGSIAARYADCVVLTTDDPYDDDPKKIIRDIIPGIASAKPEWKQGKQWFCLVDRTQAIARALSLARRGDMVLILGKGSEQTMAVAGGKMIAWNDAAVVRELIGQA